MTPQTNLKPVIKFRTTLILVKLAIAFAFFAAYVSSASATHSPHGTEIIYDLHNGVSATDYRYIDHYSYPAYKIYYDDDAEVYYRYADRAYASPYHYANYYNYNYGYRFRDSDNCNYFDRRDLEIEENKICAWANKGDWREEIQRKRAINFLYNSATERYYNNEYKLSGEAYDYNFNDDADESAFRYRYAYSPRLDGVNSKYNYYYEPQKDANGAWNWRF